MSLTLLVSVLNSEVANTDKQNDTFSEMFQCGYRKYRYSWNVAQPIK